MKWLSKKEMGQVSEVQQPSMGQGVISLSEREARNRKWYLAKDEGVSALVVTAILIVVAVVLCMVFKDQLQGLLSNIVGKVEGKVNATMSN